MKKTHIFFDLDHTLWDFEKNSELCFQQIFKEQALEIDFNLFIETYVPINFSYWKLFREEKISKEDLRYNRLKDTFNSLDYEVSDALIEVISEDFIKYLSNYNYLIEGSIDVLNYLSGKYTLHIITNGFKGVQELKLKNSKLDKYFDAVITSECIGVKKPNPRIFEYALEKANAKAEESIMIGDSLEADVLGAFHFGIKPIHLNVHKTKQTEQNEFITIKRLVELKQYL